ncbi:UNKNOWN [Stylonychia lemnae]|uniref:Uncharacterized protein n=1 Tax=Stylonychia lemnae TaxID=5949 RepID=A0A078B6B1_STYLE|nr:UNKNOWN [Stylonychia lemnae]|eukprot:CDW89894.1 UNKNOWN [Stylonychia lemnae]
MPSVGLALRNLLNFIRADFNSKIVDFANQSQVEEQKFQALSQSHQFQNQYTQQRTQADLYRQYVVGFDGKGQYDRDPSYDLKAALWIFSHQPEYINSEKLIDIANFNRKDKNLVEILKSQCFGQFNYMLRKGDEKQIEAKIQRILKEKSQDGLESLPFQFDQIHIPKILSVMLRLDFIQEDMDYILNVIDYSFDSLDDQMKSDNESSLKTSNRAEIIRQFMKKLVFKKFMVDLSQIKQVKNLRCIQATQSQNESIQFELVLAQNERPLALQIENLDTKIQNVHLRFSRIKIELFKLSYNRPLPITENSQFIKMSKNIPIQLNGSNGLRVDGFIATINQRHQYLKLIEYFESFQDEINLSYPQLQISLNGENQSIELLLYTKSKLVLQIVSGKGLLISESSHLTLNQQKIINEMLLQTNPKDFNQVQCLFKILVPHSFFHLLECELRKNTTNPFIHKSIDEFVDLRRAVLNTSLVLHECDTYPTAPIFQTWLMKTLQQSFRFELKDLVKTYKQLYSDQMIIVVNVKPAVGELELRLEKRPRNIIFVKIAIDQEERRIQRMSDIVVTVEHTQVIHHIAGQSPMEEYRLQGEGIDFDQLVNLLIGENEQ